jgi:hypothetical protein
LDGTRALLNASSSARLKKSYDPLAQEIETLAAFTLTGDVAVRCSRGTAL